MTITKQDEEILIDAIENDSPEVLLDFFKKDSNILGLLSDGQSLLHKAFACRKYQCSQHLILLGANINIQDNFGRTPIHYSCRSGFYEGANLLTLLNCDLNLQDHKGRIPLMHAIKFKQMPLVKIMMNRGSDNDIEDSNGFNSLMWAVMHLSPEELKAMMTSSDEGEQNLAKKLEETISTKSTDVGLKVSSEIIEETLKETSAQAPLPEMLPSYLQDVIRERVKTPEVMASYSITEHIESLKEKAHEEGFDYQMIVTNPNNPEQVEYENGDIYSFESKPEKNQVIEKANYSISVSNKNKDDQSVKSESVTKVNNEKASDETSALNNDINKVISKTETATTVQSEKVNITHREIDTVKNEKIHVGEYQINSRNAEVQEIKRGEIDPKTLNANEDVIKLKKNKDSTDQEKAKDQVVKSNKKEDLTPKNWTGEGHVDHIKDEATKMKKSGPDKITEVEIQKINRPEGYINKVESDSMTIKRILKENPEKDEEDSSNKSNMSKDSKDPIVTTKKNITYLRDGYRDEIKEEYGEIRTVDKNLEDDTFGVLKSGDRIIKDEYGEIKTVNKNLVNEEEVSELKAGVRSKNENVKLIVPGDKTKPEARITVSKSEAKPNDANDKERIKRPETYDHKSAESQEIKRPKLKNAQTTDSDGLGSLEKLNTSISKKEMEEELASYKIAGTKTTNEDNEIQRISSNKNSDIDSEKQVIKGNEDESENISEEEQKALDTVVDPNQKNSKGQTLAWIAAEKGQLTLLKKIILKGADYEVKDQKGFSCLMTAAINGHNDVVDYLCHKVRNIDEKRTDGHTALSLAIENDKADVAKVLIDNGAGVDTKLKGHSLLMHAASLGAVKSIKLLIMLGLDPLEKNFRGKNSLDLAKAAKKKDAYLVLAKIAAARLQQAKGK